jgi:hypothetical protein
MKSMTAQYKDLERVNYNINPFAGTTNIDETSKSQLRHLDPLEKFAMKVQMMGQNIIDLQIFGKKSKVQFGVEDLGLLFTPMNKPTFKEKISYINPLGYILGYMILEKIINGTEISKEKFNIIKNLLSVLDPEKIVSETDIIKYGRFNLKYF